MCDTFTQTGAGAVTRTVQAKFAEHASVLDYGADPTGVADSTTSFNDALAACSDIFVPPGTYVLSDAIAMKSGQRLRGAGRRNTTLRMLSAFNGAAMGLLAFARGEPGPEVEDLSIVQDQPDSVTPLVYPPAVYAQNVPRFAIRRCRIACVYGGIDMKQNSGGAVIDDLELSALRTGIDIDGALDTVRISKLHSWPFGNAADAQMTANQRTAFLASTCIKSGRCDDLRLRNCTFLGAQQEVFLYASSSGCTFGSVSGCDFDTNGGLRMSAGELYVSDTTFSLDDPGSLFANIAGGNAQFSNCNFICSTVPNFNGFVTVSGGASAIFNGCTIHGAALDKTLVYAASGEVVVNGCYIIKNAGTYGNPLIWFAGNAGGVVSGNYVAPGTSGKLVRVDSDSGVSVTGNVAPNWGVTMPAGTAPNTRVAGNIGPANADEYEGYFSADAVTTVKLPAGWSVSRLAVGNYSLTHNLALTAASDFIASLAPDGGAISAAYSLAESTVNAARIRTSAGSASADSGVFFRFSRWRG